MALVLLGGGVTDIRGSIGGTTFSRNQGGNYARARTKPINQRSWRQTARRCTISECGRHWWDTLTVAQRTAWNTYAEETSWTNRLGQTISISGMAAFVRTNTYLRSALEDMRAAAPPTGGHAGQCNFVFTALPTAGHISISSVDPPWDVDTDDDFMFVYMGLPSSPGREAFPKTFRFITPLKGDSVTPITFPKVVASAWTMGAGQIITVGMVHVDPDGRVSARSLNQVVASDP